MNYLFHLTECDGFDFDLSPPSLAAEGFVHLSDASQVLGTANLWFKGKGTLKLLVLDPGKLNSELLKWEDTYNKGREYPHYYAALPEEAISAVGVLKRNQDGDYVWPETLGSLQSPLLEATAQEKGIIEPCERFPEKKLPSLCLLNCLPGVSEIADAKVIEGLGSAIGASRVQLLTVDDQEIVICRPGVGGPVAAATLEELIALGCQKFLFCGGAGSLLEEQALGHLILVNRAWRDEGTSYHYLQGGPSVEVNPALLGTIRRGLNRLSVDFTEGASWTTDALYREVPSRMRRRRESGCLTVEMELASLLAVAKFREVELGALLFCGDDVGSESWDFRDWTSAVSVQERLFWLGIELLKSLS